MESNQQNSKRAQEPKAIVVSTTAANVSDLATIELMGDISDPSTIELAGGNLHSTIKNNHGEDIVTVQ